MFKHLFHILYSLMLNCTNIYIANICYITGMRPLVPPGSEPMTVLMNGAVDNRDFNQPEVENTEPYSEALAAKTELLIDDMTSCYVQSNNMIARMGSAAQYVNSKVRYYNFLRFGNSYRNFSILYFNTIWFGMQLIVADYAILQCYS